MSGFDDNPFGEPVDNPFEDPAVQHVASKINVQNSLEGYQPFHDEVEKNKAPILKDDTIPHFTRSNQHEGITIPQISTEELEKRKQELDRKAAELDERERQMQGNFTRLNNWPPLPEKCCFRPCFYQDINVEIRPEFQRIVRKLYYCWMFYMLTMLANTFGGLLLMLNNHEFSTFGLSLLYLFLFTPASYLCWFRPAYKAFRNDSSFNFMVFFFVFFFQTLLTVFQAIGLPDSGYCGLILALKHFEKTVSGVFIFILLLIIAIAFGLCAAVDVFLLTKIHTIYRSTGASMAKAQAEFTSEFLKNQHVQQATTSAMSSAINSQLGTRY